VDRRYEMTIYNKYGNPHLSFEDNGKVSKFQEEVRKMELAVEDELIPLLDDLELDEVAFVVSFVCSNGHEMFKEYMEGRYPTHLDENRGSLRTIAYANLCYATAKVVALECLQPYLDTLDYYTALEATQYIAANLGMIFAHYQIARSMAARIADRQERMKEMKDD
jgi:hypothetical protein